jgi:hypothetical protein
MNDPKFLMVKPEDVVPMATDADGNRKCTSDKTISVNMDKILCYGIENIVDIRSYNIEIKDGMIHHHVVFNSGGTLDLSIDSEGNFSANVHEMSYKITGRHSVLIKENASK